MYGKAGRRASRLPLEHLRSAQRSKTVPRREEESETDASTCVNTVADADADPCHTYLHVCNLASILARPKRRAYPCNIISKIVREYERSERSTHAPVALPQIPPSNARLGTIRRHSPI